MNEPILPDVTVQLTGEDGNVFRIMGAITQAMSKAGHGDKINQFREEVMSGDYNNALRVCMKWVNVK